MDLDPLENNLFVCAVFNTFGYTVGSIYRRDKIYENFDKMKHPFLGWKASNGEEFVNLLFKPANPEQIANVEKYGIRNIETLQDL